MKDSFFCPCTNTLLRKKPTDGLNNRAGLSEVSIKSYSLKVLTLFLIVVVSLTSVALATPSDDKNNNRETSVLVLQNMHVLSMQDDQIRADQTIIIRDNKIEWVGNANEAEYPEGALIVSGDFYVMPGLAEMHAHVPVSANDPTPMYNVLAMYVSQGITTIRGMLGHPLHLELRNQSASGEILAPRIFTSGPSFSGNTARDTTIARQMVRHQARDGYDLLKLHPGLSLEVFDAIVDEANKVGIDFSGHVSHDVGLQRALSAGYGSIEHLDRYMEFLAEDPSDREDPPIIYFGYDLATVADQNRIQKAAQNTLKAGVWNVPTNTLLQNIFDPALSIEEMRNWPGMEYMHEGTVDNWSVFVERIRNSDDYLEPNATRFLESRLMLTKSLHDVGAGLLLGADAPQIFNPPGFSIHRELELLVRAGLSPFEALRTGTSNVAIYFGESNSAGYIAPGYRADLIVLSVNPIASIPFGDYIEAVIVSGRFHSREALEERLAEIR